MPFRSPDEIGNPSVDSEEAEPSTGVPRDARTDDALVDSQPATRGLVVEYTPTLKRKLEELSCLEACMDDLEIWYKKVKRMKGEYWSMVQAFQDGISLSPQQEERVDDLSKEVEEILNHGKSSPLVTTKLVGDESENKIKEICDYLTKDEIFIIGVYGMGGVGKTAILMHVHNRVLLENSAFNDVFWVTVPQKFSVYELQDKIANAIGLANGLEDTDVEMRACILDRLLRKKRSVLILDGLWMHFKVQDVGIPIEKGGLKLVLTTRLLDVCRKMFCQKQIKIQLLDQPHAWKLFSEKLCFRRALSPEIEEIARSIVDECDRLPLGIIEIAVHMRGVEEVHKWKTVLRKLEDSSMKLNVFEILKLSYMNLGDPQVQKCFLHFVLCFGEDLSEIGGEDLIESFIDEGLLGGATTRQELYDEGNTILDKLRRCCLWDDTKEEKYLYVHPLIRNMALQIVTSTTHMVKAKMGLNEIPEEEFWTDHLEKVFLQGNSIKEIPDCISPNCPKLTRLSLNDNDMLTVIHKSFFSNLNGLKVLDLSNTRIADLPDSLSHLENLEALLLRGCDELRHIPYVGKLGSLKKMDLSGCVGLKEVPEGIEMLVKLTYLDLDGTEIETLPKGVLEKLVNLQYLAIKEVRAEEETKLDKVEALYCCVPDVETFNACVRFLEQNSSKEYQLGLNVSSERGDYERRIIIERCDEIVARVDGGIRGDGCALLLENVQVLEVEQCGGVTRLCNIGPLESLEELEIEDWGKLEELGPLRFPRLRKLNITQCSELEHLLKWEWLITGLPNLESIHISNCEKLKEIIAGPLRCGAMLLCLPFLKRITVQDCKGIEVIIGTAPDRTHSCFPHLTHLILRDLPELKSICNGTMGCDSIKRIDIKGCPRLKRIPLQLPLLNDGLPSPPPSLREIKINQRTWESLEWDQPLAASSLERFLRFHA